MVLLTLPSSMVGHDTHSYLFLLHLNYLHRSKNQPMKYLLQIIHISKENLSVA